MIRFALIGHLCLLRSEHPKGYARVVGETCAPSVSCADSSLLLGLTSQSWPLLSHLCDVECQRPLPHPEGLLSSPFRHICLANDLRPSACPRSTLRSQTSPKIRKDSMVRLIFADSSPNGLIQGQNSLSKYAGLLLIWNYPLFLS